MKDKRNQMMDKDALFITVLLIALVISSYLAIHHGKAFYNGIKGTGITNSQCNKKTKKAEVNNRKEPIKKLYKDAFNEKR